MIEFDCEKAKVTYTWTKYAQSRARYIFYDNELRQFQWDINSLNEVNERKN